MDLPAAPQDNSAISVLHGDDGTVTVQEVSRVQEGDTTITEWKKVRRTQSRTEERETDTIKERMVTSPGGTSSMYEKDVSKTKRKITSRGSDYFSRNNYNLRRLKDLEGAEIVEHELTSVSENMSVTNNKSWGSKSEAKVVLNKDENSEQSCKVITAVGSPKAGDMTLTSGQSVAALTPQVHLTLSKTSSGYGSVSGSEGEERDDVIETPLGRPSGLLFLFKVLYGIYSLHASYNSHTACREFLQKTYFESMFMVVWLWWGKNLFILFCFLVSPLNVLFSYFSLIS